MSTHAAVDETPLNVAKGVDYSWLLLLLLLGCILLDHKPDEHPLLLTFLETDIPHARSLGHDLLPHRPPEPHLCLLPLGADLVVPAQEEDQQARISFEPLSQEHHPGGEQVERGGSHVGPKQEKNEGFFPGIKTEILSFACS